MMALQMAASKVERMAYDLDALLAEQWVVQMALQSVLSSAALMDVSTVYSMVEQMDDNLVGRMACLMVSLKERQWAVKTGKSMVVEKVAMRVVATDYKLVGSKE